MSGPDLLERVRMCLAEVGEDSDQVWVDPVRRVLCYGPRVAVHNVWRARELVATGVDGPANNPICWACFQASPRDAIQQRNCLATRPCMEDCGLDRGSVDLPALLVVTVPTLFAMAAALFGPQIRWLVGYVATCIGLSLFAAALMAVGAVLVVVAHRCLLAAARRVAG